MKKVFLNNQRVFELPPQAGFPTQGALRYAKVVIPFSGNEGARNGNKAHVQTVRRSKLEYR